MIELLGPCSAMRKNLGCLIVARHPNSNEGNVPMKCGYVVDAD